MLGIGPVHCDMATGSVDPTGGLVHDTVGCGAGGVISDVAGGWRGCWGVLGGLGGVPSVVECCLVVVGTVPIVHNVALGKQGSSLILDGCGLIWDVCCVVCDVADV